MNSKERLESLLLQVEDVELRTLMQHELRTILTDQQRLVTMLEQRFDLVENEGRELKLVINDSQRRYEKAVREMQFFKKKYDALKTDAASIYSNHRSINAPSMFSGASSIISVPITPTIRSSISTNITAMTGNSMIQQRRTDPLTFGGSDALWDTISKDQGSDVTIDKIISNFLRRGGSPNTAKQSPSSYAIKYGYGMIHALIVKKVPSSLDTLLQQGANPNVMSISQLEEEKVSPCYLAAAVGWLEGLEKLVEAGGDLMSARGAGSKKKTALHVAAENGNAAIVEYIVNVTQGVLNLETDMTGANALHYACVSVCQVPVNETDYRGEIPLHRAVRSGRIEVVVLLVERYGSEKLSTPYDLAKSMGHKKIAEFLKSAGGLTSKKMDKRKEEERLNTVPQHLESILTKNGFFMD
ncbi:ankyrin repeat-containing domain protein [Pilaira anomala]|nr:ankyrin repeat-containing domain protein [Pilaira anomala]